MSMLGFLYDTLMSLFVTTGCLHEFLSYGRGIHLFRTVDHY